MPTVSVIIPAHNRAALLGDTLDSVRAQSFADWECVIVDDASSDDTPEVARMFMREDGRFRLVSGRFGSASAARDAGAERATGALLSFLDSDDLMAPDKLAWQVDRLRRDPTATIVYGDTLQFRTGDDPKVGTLYGAGGPRPTSFEELLGFSAIYAPTVRADAFRAAGGFDTSLASAEDWDMWLTLARAGGLIYEPRPSLYYRLHSGNKSKNTLRNFRCALRVAAKHLRHVPPARRPRVAWRTWRYFARVYPLPLLQDAAASRDRRERAAARHQLAAAALLRPRWLVRYPSAWLGLPSLVRSSA